MIDGLVEFHGDGIRLVYQIPENALVSLLPVRSLTTRSAVLVIAASLIDRASTGGKSGVSSRARDIASSTSRVISNTSFRSWASSTTKTLSPGVAMGIYTWLADKHSQLIFLEITGQP